MNESSPYEQRFEVDPRLETARLSPFCGSRGIGLSKMGNYVRCYRCGADGPEIQLDRHNPEIWRLAVERWNQRS